MTTAPTPPPAAHRRRPWRAAAAVLMVAAVGGAYAVSRSAAREEAALASRAAAAPPSRPTPAPVPPLNLDPADVPAVAPVTSAADLAAVGARAAAVVARVRPAVVAVRAPSDWQPDGTSLYESGASGVIVSADGLVLSQAHVSHHREGQRLRGENPHAAGEKTTVTLPDGRFVPATLLGHDDRFDLSLLRLDEPGPYPFAPVEPTARVGVGTWVLKLGHPGARRPDRPAPARLGRVLAATGDAFLADCPIESGDSGGPYFDLDGRLAGLIHRGDITTELAFDKDLAAAGRPGLGFVALMAAVSAPRIAALLPSLESGAATNGGASQTFTALAAAPRLPVVDRFRGGDLGGLFPPPAGSVVRLIQGDVPIGFATVVRADAGGAVAVTAASRLRVAPRYRPPGDGEAGEPDAAEPVPAEVLGFDPDHDLAVLRLPVGEFTAWDVAADDAGPPAGSFVFAPTPGEPGRPANVAVGTRRFAGPADRWEKLPPRGPAATRLSMDAEPVDADDERVADDAAGKDAAVGLRVRGRGDALPAELRRGDLLVAVGGAPVRSFEDFEAAFADRTAGDLVGFTVRRDGAETTVRVPLPPAGREGYPPAARSDGYAAALEFSPPGPFGTAGGPLVDPAGRLAGVTLGREGASNDYAGFAAPPAAVAAVLAKLDAGTLAAWGSD